MKSINLGNELMSFFPPLPGLLGFLYLRSARPAGQPLHSVPTLQADIG